MKSKADGSTCRMASAAEIKQPDPCSLEAKRRAARTAIESAKTALAAGQTVDLVEVNRAYRDLYSCVAGSS